ncbi:MAG: hypothetical protein AAFW47_01900 [Pseudomonadota bacterium]
MNEKVENLILEQLRHIRSDIGRLDNRMDTLAAEMLAMRHEVTGVKTLQDHDHSDIASIKARLDRIETRLDLVE